VKKLAGSCGGARGVELGSGQLSLLSIKPQAYRASKLMSFELIDPLVYRASSSQSLDLIDPRACSAQSLLSLKSMEALI